MNYRHVLAIAVFTILMITTATVYMDEHCIGISLRHASRIPRAGSIGYDILFSGRFPS